MHTWAGRKACTLNPMKNILITGSKGKIGSVLTRELSKKYHVTGLDLPEHDISNYQLLLNKMQGVDVVIHVAYSPGGPHRRENWKSNSLDPANVQLEMNVLHAAVEAGVGRVIMASSVHADDFNSHEGPRHLTAPGSYAPASPYGTHKLIMEEIGKFYAFHHGIEFVGVRFGGVSHDNSVKPEGREPAVWLSHRDLARAIEACVAAPEVPDGHTVFYAVSYNTGKLHNTDNPFGWSPQDNSDRHRK
jgi:nucleoside-diphosphate-sugar epimerase